MSGVTIRERKTDRRLFTHQEDAQLLRLRKAGFVWSQIAADMPGRTAAACQQRHITLQRKGAAPPNPPRESAPYDPSGLGSPPNYAPACDQLLRRQLMTDQCSWSMRAAWVARHGNDAGSKIVRIVA